jgi:IS605 OrfB family transposase
MSKLSKTEVVDASKLVRYVTVTGRLVPISSEDHMKLARLAHDFKRAVLMATRMVAKGVREAEILRELRKRLNKAYADSAFKTAKAIVEGCSFNGGNPLHIEVRKLFIVSEGEASRLGNRNVRFEGTDVVKVKYPYDGSWLSLKAEFGEEHLPLVKELVDLAERRRISYHAKIVFRSGKVYLHLSIPIELYLKHLGRGRGRGELVAGVDLNSDRACIVVVDSLSRVRDVKTEWFSELASHGFSRRRARARRLEALSKLLEYARDHNVGVVVFEDLFKVKRRRSVKSRKANRKISKFAKRELLQHGMVMALKRGFEVLLVEPRGTTSSEEHAKVMKELGLDKHVASAYLIALRGLYEAGARK